MFFRGFAMNQILTFDCYGTLLDTSPLYEFIGNAVSSEGIEAEKAVNVFCAYEDRLMYGEDFLPYDTLLYEILSYCDMELDTKKFALLYNKLISVYNNFEPFPDVLPALKKLKDKGYDLAIMSNSTKNFMKFHLEKMNNLFNFALTADEAKCYKPELEFFKMAEDAFERKEKEHCHIARGYWWDIVPARKMGWERIWVNRSRLSCGRDEEMPYITITSLSELPQLKKL